MRSVTPTHSSCGKDYGVSVHLSTPAMTRMISRRPLLQDLRSLDELSQGLRYALYSSYNGCGKWRIQPEFPDYASQRPPTLRQLHHYLRAGANTLRADPTFTPPHCACSQHGARWQRP